MRTRGWKRVFHRWWFWALAVAVALAAWFALRPSPVEDRSPESAALADSIEAWAKRRGLRFNAAGSRRAVRTGDMVRWVSFDLGFWRPPRRSPTVLARELAKLAAARGMRTRPPRVEGPVSSVEFQFADGRPAGRVWMRRECLVAIVVDDMGYSAEQAKRVLELPIPVTCAIIPGTVHCRRVDRMAVAAGKEVYIHMPMESPFRAPDVPEYRFMLKVGMTGEEVDERIGAALAAVPHATGMNNHQGSRATGDPALMRAVMASLKARNLVFMDSGTTLDSVAWRVARETGTRWQRRSVFIDSGLIREVTTRKGPFGIESVEAEFTKLVEIARRRGYAIGIAHVRFAATFEVIRRRIPEARRRGVEFVPASLLAGRGG